MMYKYLLFVDKNSKIKNLSLRKGLNFIKKSFFHIRLIIYRNLIVLNRLYGHGKI